VRPYTFEYRAQVEADIAAASVDFIQRHCQECHSLHGCLPFSALTTAMAFGLDP
jgi:hypothetical protein